MSYLLIIPLFILGGGILLLGALFRIQHWPYGKEMLWLGIIINTVSLIALLYKVFVLEKKAQ